MDGLWLLGLISVGLFVLLFLWSLGAEPSALSAFALQTGLNGISVERPGSGPNFTIVVPVALEMESAAASPLSSQTADMKNIRADLRLPIEKGRFLSFSLVLILTLLILGVWILTQFR